MGDDFRQGSYLGTVTLKETLQATEKSSSYKVNLELGTLKRDSNKYLSIFKELLTVGP